MYLFHFTNVGGGKLNWSEQLPDIEPRTVLKAVKKRRAIASRYPAIVFDEGEESGGIICGFRCCGEFTLKKLS